MLSNRYRIGVLGLFILLIVTSTVMYAWNFVLEAPRADAFRHIPLYVIPWFNGDFSPDLLWKNHHPRPLHGLAYIINAEFFGLSYRFESIVGIISLALITVLLFREYLLRADISFFGEKPLAVTHLLTLTAFIALLFSLSTPLLYQWSLLTFSFLSIFFSVLVYVSYSSIVRKAEVRSQVLFFILGVVLLVVNFDRGVISFLPLLFLSLSFIAMNINRAFHVRVVGVLILEIILVKGITTIMITSAAQKGIDILDKLKEIVNNPYEVIEFYAFGIASSIPEFNGIANNAIIMKPLVAFLLLAIYLCALFLFFKGKMWKESALPILLLLMPLAYITAVLITRHNFSAEHNYISTFPRYQFNYLLGWTGTLWIYSRYAFLSKGVFPKVTVFFFLVAVTYMHLHYSYLSWQRSNAIVHYNSQANLAVLHTSVGDTTKIRGQQCRYGEKGCTTTIQFLQKHQLNIFAPSYQQEFMRACGLNVLGWDLIEKKYLIVTFSEPGINYPIDLAVNGKRITKIFPHGNQLKIKVDSSFKEEQMNIEFSCYQNNHFERFGHLAVNMRDTNRVLN